MRTTIVFFCGVICSLLVAAAAFRGGTPVDYTFTYQGQLRNAGVLVNGPVDLRITLWDSDAAGAQVGPINNYQALPITDGRFAVGLNFGGTAFDGSNRWVQLEFRSPAGSGQYLTLNPRDKIMATPYAMFALNGGNGIWNYNAKAQTVSVLGQKVGIGTANPTAALEVVGAGGDDAVKLPAGSIGPSELSSPPPAASSELTFSFPPNATTTSGVLVINCPGDGFLLLIGGGQSYVGLTLLVDGVETAYATHGVQCNGPASVWSIHRRLPITRGAHSIAVRGSGCASGSLVAIYLPLSM